jgi:hypothetical protein
MDLCVYYFCRFEGGEHEVSEPFRDKKCTLESTSNGSNHFIFALSSLQILLKIHPLNDSNVVINMRK